MSEGFLSLSFEVSESEPTYRGEQYCGSWFCLDPEGDAYGAFIENGREDRKAYAGPRVCRVSEELRSMVEVLMQSLFPG